MGLAMGLATNEQEGRVFLINSYLIRLIHLFSLYIEVYLTHKQEILISKAYLTPKQAILFFLEHTRELHINVQIVWSNLVLYLPTNQA
jgi:hypothetical protein